WAGNRSGTDARSLNGCRPGAVLGQGGIELSLLSQPTLSHYLILGAILFAISVIGIFLNRRNVLIMLMAIELMLLAVNLNFIAFSCFLVDIVLQLFVFFILKVSVSESAIGLAIL